MLRITRNIGDSQTATGARHLLVKPGGANVGHRLPRSAGTTSGPGLCESALSCCPDPVDVGDLSLWVGGVLSQVLVDPGEG